MRGARVSVAVIKVGGNEVDDRAWVARLEGVRSQPMNREHVVGPAFGTGNTRIRRRQGFTRFFNRYVFDPSHARTTSRTDVLATKG